ncbi:hypothetical protein AMTRI_Chr03g44570 [Amborella trichopoda]|uniref:SBP-type domain-containing protein n=1 Tax=Amborella trichopoda TaxID=13333 RepID=W1PUX8_AMBTC|nr:squamosa promoter-binding-like protein 14 [Amborella trichopoda]ERN11629.1 hypothetical protein AMTR_s00022p00198330 [Amborella trichopoda]|eukprot:XP_006850048.1 squamosa promoter-binding-like protein 14 [Amborella trichopoda]
MDYETMNGLKLGKRIYFEDVGSGNPAKKPPENGNPSTSSRKTRVSGQNGQPPSCQVEGCKADLTGAKPYYCRHKVCGAHSKSPKVIVAGLEQRFCQQCSRFHQLPEFDQGKRSCRRRLAGHNERRRKPPPSTLSARYGRFPSSLYGDSRHGGFVMDFSHPKPLGKDIWPTIKVSDRIPFATPQMPPLKSLTHHHPWHSNTSTTTIETPINGGGEILTQGIHTYLQQGSTVGPTFSGHGALPSECSSFPRMSDSGCALSLLSTHQPWGAKVLGPGPPLDSIINEEGPLDTQVAPLNLCSSLSQGPMAPDQNGPPYSGELELLQHNRQFVDLAHLKSSYGHVTSNQHLMQWGL